MTGEPVRSVSLSKKVCLLGDFAVGKTSLVRRFVYDLFDDKYVSTIGVKVSRKTVAVPRAGEIVELTLMLWDLAGSEEFDRVRASYLRGAAGAVLVCDLTRPAILTSLQEHACDLRTISPGVRLLVAANKRDLVEPALSEGEPVLDPERIEAEAASFDAPYYLTSAKFGDEVEALFRHLGQLLVNPGPEP
jgi:small GTP-binding protein